MVGSESIRDVIAFPKTTAARGLMEGAPSPLEPGEIEELGLRLSAPAGAAASGPAAPGSGEDA
jgi:aspartyl-tRNA synthetase